MRATRKMREALTSLIGVPVTIKDRRMTDAPHGPLQQSQVKHTWLVNGYRFTTDRVQQITTGNDGIVYIVIASKYGN